MRSFCVSPRGWDARAGAGDCDRGLSLLLEVLMLRRVGEEFRANQPTENKGRYISCGPMVVDGEMRDRLINKKCQRHGSKERADESGVPPELDGEPDHDHQKNQRQDRWRVRASSPEQHGNADRSKAYGRTDQLANARR